MARADEFFSLIVLDLPGRVLPFFEESSPLTAADLIQLVGKYRGQFDDTTGAGAAPVTAEGAYVPILRRRRR